MERIMFEDIPPWAYAQAAQQQPQQAFNPAPFIMSPYAGFGGGGGPPRAPQQQLPANSGVSATPVPFGSQFASLLGNPSAAAANSNNPASAGMGSGGLLQLIAAMQNGRQQQQPQSQTVNSPGFNLPGIGNTGPLSQTLDPASSGQGAFTSWLMGLLGRGGGNSQ
jgi:hypothetical protein